MRFLRRSIVPIAISATVALTILSVSARAIPADPLARLIGDRVAGESVNCIDRFEIDKARIIDGIGILYEMKTGPFYLNRPVSGLAFLHDGVVLAIGPAGSRLCSVELVRVINPNSRAPVGAVSLGQFTAYRKPVTP